MLNIGVLVSGGGTNLQKLIDAQQAGNIPNGRLRVVIASRPDAYALERARQAGIEAITLARKDYPDVYTYSQALADALNEGRIAGAGIDVFEMEPPVPEDHPLLLARHVLATPHVAFATGQSMEKRAALVCENLRAWLAGSAGARWVPRGGSGVSGVRRRMRPTPSGRVRRRRGNGARVRLREKSRRGTYL